MHFPAQPPVIAGIGSTFETFVNGGGIGTYVKTALLLLGIALILAAVVAVAKNVLQTPPRIAKGVGEAFISILVATVVLVPGLTADIGNGGQDIVSGIFTTIQNFSHGQAAPPANNGLRFTDAKLAISYLHDDSRPA